MRVKDSLSIVLGRSALAGTILLVSVSCSTNDNKDAASEASTSTTAVDSSSTSTASPLASADTTTTTAILGGLNATALEARLGRGVVMVLSRPCVGSGFGQGTGFAIDSRTIVTNWHVVAEDEEDPQSAIDPHPWIMTYSRGWRRGRVIGASSAPDIAVIRLDDDEDKISTSLSWAKSPPVEGQHLAGLGYPGLEGGEFNLVVGTATKTNTIVRGIDAFEFDKRLSARTGPGNSGGPIVNASGEVVGVHTWGEFDRAHWFGQDGDVVQEAVTSMLTNPTSPPTGCAADDPNRYPLAYTVRLGTFGSPDDEQRRLDVVRDVGPAGVSVQSVNSDAWVPFLLSDYPYVLMAGPFDTRAAAQAAIPAYTAAIKAAGQEDKFSVGVFPRGVFETDVQEPEPTTCLEDSGMLVGVKGVTDSDPLKLREGPSLSAKIVNTLMNGETLVQGMADPVEADGLTWIQVGTLTDGDQQCGWVAQRFTEQLEDDIGD